MRKKKLETQNPTPCHRGAAAAAAAATAAAAQKRWERRWGEASPPKRKKEGKKNLWFLISNVVKNIAWQWWRTWAMMF